MHLTTIARLAVTEHKALQKPGELAALLALLAEHPPKIVVEIGSDAGGTLWAWQQIGATWVIGISLPGSDNPYASKQDLVVPDGVTMIYRDSHDPGTPEALNVILEGRKIDLLFIDGDHSLDGVRDDFAMYCELVAEDGLIALHDIVKHPNMPTVQVDEFWAELKSDPQLECEEITSGGESWGGIGVVRLSRAMVTA